MFYLFQPLNHLKPIREWAQNRNARLHLRVETFDLDINLRDKLIHLQPRFVVRENGQLGYKRAFEKTSTFVGWVQDDTQSWPAASDKIAFKKVAAEMGLRVPAAWNTDNFLANDYLIKTRKGSFGRDIQGPYLAEETKLPLKSSNEYYEQFISGRSSKAWCWNHEVVALEILEPPYLRGDGQRTLTEIASSVRGSMDKAISLDGTDVALARQGVTRESIPLAGEKVWLDFKYATPFDVPTYTDRDVWNTAVPTIRHQFSKATALLQNTIPVEHKGKTMYTLDAIIDHQNRVWFLEMNSHPMVHPNVYGPMLDNLFSLKS